MPAKKIFAAILVFSILFLAGCQSGEIRIHEPGDGAVSDGKLIHIAIYGKGGAAILEDTAVYADYKKNITVADISADVCRKLNVPIVISGIGPLGYVQGINNLFEFDDGPESGWLYSVNGKYQSAGCGSYALAGGDRVEWHYTLDLGKDLGAYNLE